MISAGDLRKGTTFEYDGQVYTVIDLSLEMLFQVGLQIQLSTQLQNYKKQ